MRILLLLLATANSLCLTAQQRYLPGFIVLNDGERRQVLLRTANTKVTADHVVYRPTAGAPSEQLPVAEVRTYGLDDLSERYSRFTVRIDASKQKLSELTTSPTPQYEERTVFLRQLAEGEADLYFWSSGTYEGYFLRTGADTPQLLISRRYRGQGRKVHEDRSYLAQLVSQLQCDRSRPGTLGIHEADYTEKDLLRVVGNYNTCVGTPTEAYVQSPQRVRFWLRAGVERSEVAYYLLLPRRQEMHMGAAVAPRFGLESEYALPFTRWRYSMYLGAEYRVGTTFSGTWQYKYSADREVRLDYESISLPIGVRRYLTLGKTSQLILTAGGLLDIPIGEGLNYADGNGRQIETGPSFGLQLGGGFQLFERLRVEGRYQHNRNISPGYTASFVPFRAVSAAVSYRLR